MGWIRVVGAAAVVVLVAGGCSTADQDQAVQEETQEAAAAEVSPWPVRETRAVEVAYYLADSREFRDPTFTSYDLAVEIAAPSPDPGPCGLAATGDRAVAEVTVTLTHADDGSRSDVRRRARIPHLQVVPIGDVGPLMWVDYGQCVEEIDGLLEDWVYPQEAVFTGYLAQVPLSETDMGGEDAGLEFRVAAPYWQVVEGSADPLQVLLP